MKNFKFTITQWIILSIKKGSFGKLLNALLISQISKDDCADFLDFSICFVSVESFTNTKKQGHF